MFDLFNFLSMDSYESRKVARYDGEDGFFISTAAVNDSDHPFETAVAHPLYNGGGIVIVEMYDSKEEAQEGHDRWVNKMTASDLPETLSDVSTSGIVKLAAALGADLNGIFLKENS